MAAKASDTPFSIVLPCYNPPDKWKVVVRECFTDLLSQFPFAELIIVNDGSTKNFDAQLISNYFADLKSLSIFSYTVNHGKGYALRYGVEKAKNRKIIYTDIDFPYTKESLLNILDALNQCDLAIGVRSEEYYTHLPKARVRISKFLRFFIRKFLRIPTDDTQCGLKGFTQKGKEVFLQTTIDRYLFDLEFVFLAARKKLNIKTVVANLRPEIQLSKMNWKILIQEAGNFLKIFIRSFF